MAYKEAKNVQKIVAGLVKTIAGRNRDIVSRRFGLSNGKKETLESIGKSYGITRERVRQIEEFTLAQLAKGLADNKDVEKYVSLARAILAKEGGIMKERDLFREFSGGEKDSAVNASLVFLLSLNKDFVRFGENDRFASFWASDAKQFDSLKGAVASLTSAFNKNDRVVAQKELLGFAKKSGVAGLNGGELTDKHLETFMSVCKDLNRNIYGEVGLASWAEVRPKGVRDKAYLIMKKVGEPRHFNEIAKLINAASFGDGKKVNVQTVHNELIKDQRFVLVGRGMYALSEWGYKSGTVKDVLVDVLRSSAKPLSRSELVAKVMDARMVKENTILLNLQDSASFAKNADGTYTLRKA